MKRKVNKVGPNTLTVSLPKKWVERNNIKKGCELEIDFEEKYLIIRAEGNITREQLRTAEVSIPKNKLNFIRAILGAYYQNGYDIINVQFEDEISFHSIQEAVGSLLGCEIIEKNDNTCTIKSYLGDSPNEFNSVLNRMINIVKVIQSTTLEDYNKGNTVNKDVIKTYRFSSWKLRDLCLRLLHKGETSHSHPYEYFLLIWTLEKITRTYSRFYRNMIDGELKHRPQISEMFIASIEMFDQFACLVNHRDISKIEQFNEKSENWIKESIEISAGIKKDNILTTHLIDAVSRMRDVTSALILIDV